MHDNKAWFLFLALITLAMAWFTWNTVGKTREFFLLSEKTEAENITWSVLKKDEEKYLLSAEYSFQAGDRQITKKETASKPVYPNPWAAEQAARKERTKNRRVWYSKNSSEHASLFKEFPTKELISAAILWALWIYFLWLGYYVGKFSRN